MLNRPVEGQEKEMKIRLDKKIIQIIGPPSLTHFYVSTSTIHTSQFVFSSYHRCHRSFLYYTEILKKRTSLVLVFFFEGTITEPTTHLPVNTLHHNKLQCHKQSAPPASPPPPSAAPPAFPPPTVQNPVNVPTGLSTNLTVSL